MNLRDVPSELVDKLIRTYEDIVIVNTDLSEVVAREILVAVLPEHEKQVRRRALIDAYTAIVKLQMVDADRLAVGGHGSWCAQGETNICHGAEAHATHERVLAALRALRGES